MNVRNLKICSYMYLVIPIIIFFMGWIKLIYAIPLSIAVIVAIIIANKKRENKDENQIISKKKILLISFLILIVCILAGQGGLFYQSVDHHWRNAIFRDLINSKWPVYYSFSDCYLDYYIGHWLVPAGIAKIFLPFSENLAWWAGNICLLVWSTIGVTLTFLWIINIIKEKNKKNILIALAIFIFFSGLDILGLLITGGSIDSNLHIEWWANKYQFSSISTQLFWVFNQSIAAWLVIMLFLQEKNVKNYFLLIILLLPYAPLPFVGAIPLFACNGFKYLYKSIKEKELKKFWKEVFSIQNIIALICILPIYYFFYSLNEATSQSGFRLYSGLLTFEEISKLIVFWFLEIGLYAIPMIKTYKKLALFWVSFIILIFIPLFKIGGGLDFSMRASIPALIVCMIFVIDFLLNQPTENNKIKKYIIIGLLVIGSITPLFEYGRAISKVIETKNIRAVADSIVTYSDKPKSDYSNFLAENSRDKSIFLKYLIKNKN